MKGAVKTFRIKQGKDGQEISIIWYLDGSQEFQVNLSQKTAHHLIEGLSLVLNAERLQQPKSVH